mgnify:CR=1 FL=1
MRAQLPALDDDENPPPLDPPGYDSDDEVIVLSPANYPNYSRPANYPNYRRRLGDIGGLGKHVVAAATEEVCSRGALHVHCLIWEASSTLLTYVSKYLHMGSGVSTKHLTCKL